MTEIERTTGKGHYLPWIFILGDLMVVNLMFALLIVIYPQLADNMRYARELWLMVQVSFVPMAIITLQRTHENRVMLMEREMRTIIYETVVFALVFLSLTTFLHIPSMAVSVYLLFFGLVFCGVSIFEIGGKLYVKKRRREGFNYAREIGRAHV